MWTSEEIAPLLGLAIPIVLGAIQENPYCMERCDALLKQLSRGLVEHIAQTIIEPVYGASLSYMNEYVKVTMVPVTSELFARTDKSDKLYNLGDATVDRCYPHLMSSIQLGTVRTWLLSDDGGPQIRRAFAEWYVRRAKELDEWEGDTDDLCIAKMLE